VVHLSCPELDSSRDSHAITGKETIRQKRRLVTGANSCNTAPTGEEWYAVGGIEMGALTRREEGTAAGWFGVLVWDPMRRISSSFGKLCCQVEKTLLIFVAVKGNPSRTGGSGWGLGTVALPSGKCDKRTMETIYGDSAQAQRIIR
jgi:hypothetical protein